MQVLMIYVNMITDTMPVFAGVYNEGDVNITIDRFENNTDRDLETLAYNLAWMTKKERGRLSAY